MGVSDRVAFLRKTYAHLGVALIAFAAITAGMMKFMTVTSLKFSLWAIPGLRRFFEPAEEVHRRGVGWNWLLVIVAFMLVGYLARRLAASERSRTLQYAGLSLAVVIEAVILQPLLWLVILRFGDPGMVSFSAGGLLSGQAASILMQAVVITLAIFSGLTVTVFVTKKDFTFLRGALVIATFAALGVIGAALMFGFSLGALFCGAMILLMAGYILYETSLLMSQFPPQAYVAASLMLFSTIATLFWYVLRLVMELNRD
jgi:uncharacterized protein